MPRNLLIIALFSLSAGTAIAQSTGNPVAIAEQFYHDAARAYLDGASDRAERTAERGLAADPSNEKIQELLDLIRRQQESSGDSRQQNEQENPSPNGQPEDDAEENQDNKQNQERSDSSSNLDQARERQAQGRSGGSAAAQATAPPDDSRPMTRAEAARLLDAVTAEERLLLERIRRTPTRHPEKDW